MAIDVDPSGDGKGLSGFSLKGLLDGVNFEGMGASIMQAIGPIIDQLKNLVGGNLLGFLEGAFSTSADTTLHTGPEVTPEQMAASPTQKPIHLANEFTKVAADPNAAPDVAPGAEVSFADEILPHSTPAVAQSVSVPENNFSIPLPSPAP